MQCLCKNVEVLTHAPASLYLITRVPELRNKSEKLFSQLGLEFTATHGMLRTVVDDALAFVRSHYDTFFAAFNAMEREEIKLHFQPADIPINLEELLFARPMQYYLNTIVDEPFFDIITQESLTSHFQPIVDMHDGSIFAHEALVRGVHADGSLMYPGELFEKARRNEMTFRLDRLSRESALKTAAVKKLRTKVFINFIPTAIYDPTFCLNSTVQWARQLEFDPSQIVFEVVETEQVHDREHLRNILTYYREQGFQIALDDVGEGYSSLNMLINLRPDFIKVDREIIDGIDANPMKQSVYKALYTTAKEHGIAVLAEGIETKSELAFIEQAGVDYAQGYLFGKPGAEPLRRIVAGA